MAKSTGDFKKMHMPALLEKKVKNVELSDDEIEWFIKSVTENSKSLSDTQIGAMLMAIRLNGLNEKETAALSRTMTFSGKTLKWPKEWNDILVDKHSTGGVGDKVSLILAPALAVHGLKVPMISGRGLGDTGGTLDKLESINNFRIEQTQNEMHKLLETVGCCIVGQTKDIAPADKKLYAIRDITATADSIPLITASILSKKAAAGVKILVMEMTYGEGAQIKQRDDAEKLAKGIMSAGNQLGINVLSAMTNMTSPLGKTIGNAIEIIESIETLKNNGPDDLVDVICKLGACLLKETGKAKNMEDGEKLILKSLQDGSAAKTFSDMLVGQGCHKSDVDNLIKDPKLVLQMAKQTTYLKADKKSYVKYIRGLPLAQVLRKHGAGRYSVDDKLNYGVGLRILVNDESEIKSGDVWAEIFHEEDLTDNDLKLLNSALVYCDDLDTNLNKSKIYMLH